MFYFLINFIMLVEKPENVLNMIHGNSMDVNFLLVLIKNIIFF